MQSERTRTCPTCGATTDMDADVLRSIDRVLTWKEQDPENASTFDAAIAELQTLRTEDET